MTEQFNDGATTTVAQGGGIDGSSNPVTFTVASLLNFPTTGTFAIEIDNEVMMATAVNTGAVTITASRGSSATGEIPTPSLATHNNGATVKHVLSSGSIARAFARLDTAVSQTLTGPLVIPISAGGTSSATSYGSLPVKIDEQSPSAVATVNLGGATLPTGFRHLLIEIEGRGDTASTFVECGLRFNSDSGLNYGWERFDAAGAAGGPTESGITGQSSGRAWFLSAATALASTPGIARIWIPNYGASTFKTMARIDYSFFAGTSFPSASQLASDYTTIFWNNTAAITRLDLLALTGNFAAGTIMTLYGMP